MSETFIIEGSNGKASVTFRDSAMGTRTQGIESFVLTLTTEELQIKRRVNLCAAYEVHGLADFFSGLAQGGKAVVSERLWETIEGDLKLTCKCDRQTRVLMTFELRSVSFPAGYPSWTLKLTIALGAGQMASLESGIKEFCRL